MAELLICGGRYPDMQTASRFKRLTFLFTLRCSSNIYSLSGSRRGHDPHMIPPSRFSALSNKSVLGKNIHSKRQAQAQRVRSSATFLRQSNFADLEMGPRGASRCCAWLGDMFAECEIGAGGIAVYWFVSCPWPQGVQVWTQRGDWSVQPVMRTAQGAKSKIVYP